MLTGLRVAALFAAGLGASAQFGKVSMFFPAWGALYPEGGAWLGFLVSLLAMMGALLGLVAGMVVARTGFRRILVGALLLGAGVSALEALLPPLGPMLALRAVEGLSHLAIAVAAPTLIAEITTERSRPQAMTLWSTYFGMTFSLYAVTGAGLLALGGLPVVLWSHAGFMAAVALALLVLLPSDAGHAVGAPGLSLGGVIRRHVTAYSTPAIAAPGFGWFCYTLTFVALLTVIPPYLPEGRRVLLMTVMPMLSVAVSLTLGALVLRVVRGVALMVAGFVLSALSVAAMAAFAGQAWPPVLLFCALGLVQAGGFSAIPQINHTAEDRALANGAVAQMGNLGNLLGTPVLLVLTHLMGNGGFIVFGLCAYLTGAVVHVVAARMRARAVPLAG